MATLPLVSEDGECAQSFWDHVGGAGSRAALSVDRPVACVAETWQGAAAWLCAHVRGPHIVFALTSQCRGFWQDGPAFTSVQ